MADEPVATPGDPDPEISGVPDPAPPAEGGAAAGSGRAEGGVVDRPSGPPGNPQGPAVPARRSPATLLTAAVVGLVLVIVVVLVIVKVTNSSTAPGTAPAAQPLPATVAQQVTDIPAAVYNTVGIDSPTVAVSPPKVVAGQPALTLGGKPGVLYVGAEFSPFAAAQRWAIVAALSRFGKFADLQTMQSSADDVYGNTQTLSFAGATFTSRYVTAQLHEQYGNRQNSSGTGWAVLYPLTSAQLALVDHYDVTRYTGVPTPRGTAVLFTDIGNKMLAAGSGYSPSILQGLSRNQIAAALADPKNPVTQAIVATANYLSAGVCAVDHAQPASVCHGTGVAAASDALGLPG